MKDIDAVIGVDPGAKGAATLICWDGRMETIRFMKYSWGEIIRRLQIWDFDYKLKCYIEQVGAMPHDGKHNLATFMKNTGIITGVTLGLNIEIEEVNPQVWQRHHKLGAAFANKTARKNAHQALAQKYYPRFKLTQDEADAILIARYGWWKTFDKDLASISIDGGT